MKINKKDVEYIAGLAHLKITEEEKEGYAGQLSRIIEHIEKLNTLDTDQVPPTSHVREIKNIFRKDEVNNLIFRKNDLQSAPDKEKGYYKVPKII